MTAAFSWKSQRVEAKKKFITCQECDEKEPFIDFIEQRLKMIRWRGGLPLFVQRGK